MASARDVAVFVGSLRKGSYNRMAARPLASLAPATLALEIAIGGFGANHQVRQSLVALNVPVLQQPEAYIGSAATLFDKEGALVNDSTRAFLQKYLQAYAVWVERCLAR